MKKFKFMHNNHNWKIVVNHSAYIIHINHFHTCMQCLVVLLTDKTVICFSGARLHYTQPSRTANGRFATCQCLLAHHYWPSTKMTGRLSRQLNRPETTTQRSTWNVSMCARKPKPILRVHLLLLFVLKPTQCRAAGFRR